MKAKLPVSIIAFLAIVFFLMINCSDPDEVTGPAASTGSGTISGKVLDEDGNALAGVNVECSGISTVSADDGTFELNDVPESTEQLVNFTKQTYSRNQKKVAVRDGKSSYCEACLYKVGHSEEFHSSGAVNVNLTASRVSVELQADGLVYEDGTAFSGNAKMELTYFSPEKDNFFEAFPGDFIGVEEDGNEVPIESYGFIDVNVYDGDKKLQLAEGKPATLTMPIPANKIDEAPETMPLWYYDTLSGKWIEYGVAVKQGDQYVGDVPHFSTINLDMKLDELCSVKGVVVDKNNDPIERAWITLKGLDFNVAASGYTDSDGSFEFISLKTNSEIAVFASYYGVNSDTIIKTTPGNNELLDLGNITLDINGNVCIIVGKVVSNTHNSIQGAEVKVEFVNSSFEITTETDLNGEYNVKAYAGDQLKITASIIGVESEPLDIEVPDELEHYCDDIMIDINYYTCLLTGRIIDENGLPISKGNISYRNLDYNIQVHETTDDNGKFQFKNVVTMLPYIFIASNGEGVYSKVYNFGPFPEADVNDIGDIVVANKLNTDTWQKLGSISGDIKDFYFIDENIGWTVTFDKIYYTQDGGNNWTEQFDATTVDPDERLWNVRFLNNNFGWACGNDLYYTTNGGSSWQYMNFDDTYYFADAFFLDENNGWITGSYTYKTSDGGQNWLPVSADHKGNNFSEIFMTDEDNVWLTSWGFIQHSTDGGTTWEEQSIPGSNAYSDLHFTNNNNGWLINNQTIYHTSDAGNNWTVEDEFYLSSLVALSCVNDQIAFCVGSYGSVYKTVDGGQNWGDYLIGPNYVIYHTQFISENKGWIVLDENDNSVFYYTETGAE